MPKRKKQAQETAQPRDIPNHYQVGAWAGIPQYQCAHCAFDTLDKEAMLAHLYDEHGAQAEGYVPPFAEEAIAPAPEGEVVSLRLKEVASSTDDEGSTQKTYTIEE